MPTYYSVFSGFSAVYCNLYYTALLITAIDSGNLAQVMWVAPPSSLPYKNQVVWSQAWLDSGYFYILLYAWWRWLIQMLALHQESWLKGWNVSL